MKDAMCVIGALKEEIFGIKAQMDIHETVSAGLGRAYYGRWFHHPVILVRSGVGRKLAKRALEEVVSRFSISEIVSIGFAGGLEPKLETGDLIIADSVRETHSETGIPSPESLLPLDSHLLDQALRLSFRDKLTIKSGGLVTVDTPACSREEKQKLHRHYSAIAVDMETSSLLRLAISKKIPFLSVRSISDSADQELVDFSHCFNEEGEISRFKAGWHVLTNPSLLPKAETLRQASRFAAKNLTCYLKKWVSHSH